MDLPLMELPPVDEDPVTEELLLPRAWTGEVTPYVVGDPGHAAAAVLERPARDAPDHHGIVLDGAAVRPADDAPWTHVRGASVRGLRHRHDGTARQDDFCFRQTADDRYLVVAVADGVSAGPSSHAAATVAAGFGCTVVADWLGRCDLEEISWEHVLKTLSDLVEQKGRAILRRRGTDRDEWTTGELAAELATTLVLAVIDLRPDDGSCHVHVVRVGDSSAWMHRSGRWEPLHGIKNDGAEIASSSTAALPLVTSFESSADRVAGGDLLVLMTDGVGDPLGDGDNDLGRFLAEVWAAPPSVLAFGAQVDFARKSFDDDRTAVAVWVG